MNDLAYRSLTDYNQAKEQALVQPEAFWATIAKNFEWHTPWNKTLEYDFYVPEVKWFLGGKLNITENCLDRHLKTQPDQTAIIFEPIQGLVK